MVATTSYASPAQSNGTRDHIATIYTVARVNRLYYVDNFIVNGAITLAHAYKL